MKTNQTKNLLALLGRNAKGSLICGAVLALSINATAQNTTLDTDNIPNPTGWNNVILGGGNMGANVSGGANTSIGYWAMWANTTGMANTATGYGALNNNNGDFNSAYGVKTMVSITGGGFNSGFGSYCLNMINMGHYNSALGAGADASADFNNSTAIGANAIVNSNDRVWLGDVVADVWTTNSYNISDGRFKKNIDSKSVKGLDFINLLRPVVYNFDGKAFTDYITKNMPDSVRKNHLNRDFSKRDNLVQTGFIAQEVEEAAKKAGYNFSGVHKPEGSTDTYGISYYQFVVPLVKAVQEQQAMINEQKQLNEKLQVLLAEQQKAISALQERTGTATSINQINLNTGFEMSQNEPNPFTSETLVKYSLPEQVNSAYVAVYDLSGKQIATFPINQKGSSSMVLTSEKLSSGIYIYSIVADGKVIDTKKMIVADK
ncbi:MAG: tail fiber domain-containing protein [Bacteroidia bacterium]|nr:tail fiber domain-containing protein [Bacteroidia bacterium]